MFRQLAAATALTLLCAFQAQIALARPYGLVEIHALSTGMSVFAPNADGGQAVGGINLLSPKGINGSITHAMLQNGAAPATDIHPTLLTTFQNSYASATDGIQQVGYGSGARAAFVHALLWRGTADSAVDLNPSSLGITYSIAHGVGHGWQVGLGYGVVTDFQFHAVVWAGTADSAVDLNPAGAVESLAVATDGAGQVGYSRFVANGPNHAMLWAGTAASAVDLHPTTLGNLTHSIADGIGGGQQVGYGYNRTGTAIGHALLWTGTADSVVDLNPNGQTNSSASATNGVNQVGAGSGFGGDSNSHALVWSGTADSVVDLHVLLPAGLFSSSADFIDAAGNVYGTARDGHANLYAVEWAIPEPSSVYVLIAVASMRLCRRGRIRRG